jgi:hypothetical protein
MTETHLAPHPATSRRARRAPRFNDGAHRARCLAAEKATRAARRAAPKGGADTTGAAQRRTEITPFLGKGGGGKAVQ